MTIIEGLGKEKNGKTLQGRSQNVKASKDLGDLQEHVFFPIDYNSLKFIT